MTREPLGEIQAACCTVSAAIAQKRKAFTEAFYRELLEELEFSGLQKIGLL